jgi:hypothetical protein
LPPSDAFARGVKGPVPLSNGGEGPFTPLDGGPARAYGQCGGPVVRRAAGIGRRRDAGRVGPEAGLSSDLLCWFEQDSPEGMATR